MISMKKNGFAIKDKKEENLHILNKLYNKQQCLSWVNSFYRV